MTATTVNGDTQNEAILQNAINPTIRRAIFVFAGQGSQRKGMARWLFSNSQAFRQKILDCEKTCQELGYSNLLNWLLDGERRPGEVEDLVEPQLALVAFELSLAAMWRSLGIKPSAVVANSIGEYAALCEIGVLTEREALSLLHRRGQLLQKHCEANAYKMLVATGPNVDSEVSKLITALNSTCIISNFNSPRKIVVGGEKAAADALIPNLISHGFEARALEIPYAFHTNQIIPLAGEFQDVIDQVPSQASTLPYGSALLGRSAMPGEQLPPDYLVRHACESAKFSPALVDGVERGIFDSSDTWLEIGPSATCLSFVRDTLALDVENLLPSCTASSDANGSRVRDTVSRLIDQGFTIDVRRLDLA